MSLQFNAVPGRHVPKAHKSAVVHALPSSHASALLGNTQPVAALQLSVVQMLLSSQTKGAPMHAPPEHVSPVVHALRSLQAFALFVKTQPVARSHVSVVHKLPSSHSAFVVQANGAAGPDGEPVASPVRSGAAAPLMGAQISPEASVIGGAIDIKTVDSSPSALARSAKCVDINVPPRLEVRLSWCPL